MRIPIKVNEVNGVAPGNVAVVRVPVGKRFHGIRIIASGLVSTGPDVAATQASQVVTNVRVLVNGTEQRNLPTDIYQKIARLNKVVVGDLTIPIFFSETWRATATQEEMTSWDTYYSTTFTLEVTIASGIINPQIVVYSESDDIRNVDSAGKPFFLIVKQLKRSYISGGAGIQDINSVIPTGFPINRIYIQNSAGAVDNLQVFADDVLVKEATKSANDEMLSEYNIDGSQFTYAYVTDYTQQLNDPLRFNVINLRATFTAASNSQLYVEQLSNSF